MDSKTTNFSNYSSMRSNWLSIKGVLSLMMVAIVCLCGTANSINTVDIITGQKFTNTDYYLLIDAGAQGMKLV